MRGSATAYPTRRKESYWYMPLVPVACLCVTLIGVGLWVHFTLRMYYAVQQAAAILEVSLTNGPGAIARVYQSLVGTAVVYCIFSAAIMCLGAWKGWVESDQDLHGRLYEHLDWLMYANLVLQCLWGIIMIWMVLLVAGDAVFAGWMYVAKNALNAALQTQYGLNSTGAGVPVAKYVCPALCFNGNTLAFINSVSDAASWNSTLCICDQSTLLAAYEALDFGVGAFTGMYVGVLFMYVFGIFLAHWLVAMFTHMRACQDFNERLLGIAK